MLPNMYAPQIRLRAVARRPLAPPIRYIACGSVQMVIVADA
jgi:hypothetical protein